MALQKSANNLVPKNRISNDHPLNRLYSEILSKLTLPYEKILLIGENLEVLSTRLPYGKEFTFSSANPSEIKKLEVQQWSLIVLLGTLDESHDMMILLRAIVPLCSRTTRVATLNFSKVRRGYIRNKLNITKSEFNWLPRTEVANILELADFEVVKQLPEILVPHNLGPLSRNINRWLSPLPIFRQFVTAIVTIARLRVGPNDATDNRESQLPRKPSLSIIIPARNEAGNIRRILQEIPQMAPNQELIFVEGNSTDDTWKTLQAEVCALPIDYPYSVQLHKQSGKGKGDAVRLGFEEAKGAVLMILDADLTVPPKELPSFYDAVTQHKAEFANGSRLVYPQEKEAMRFLNYVANKLFGLWFTFVLGQPVRDTLCGTKVLWREDYLKIAANRAYFGEIDPFGDFDLLFGAARLNLKIRDIPVHYKERTYGSTNISRFRHGWLLLQMSVLAARKLVFAPAPKAKSDFSN